jgi:very-short-patch-repair endonuclease
MFTIHFNRYSDRDQRRFLRNNPTKSEVKLWQLLRKKQIMGYKFRRQYGLDAYVVGFYCPNLKLAIEIDGRIHLLKEMKMADSERQEYIEQFEISFLRFTNDEVLYEIENVISRIEAEVKKLRDKKEI